MFSIGVIGDYDSICGFSAVGVGVFPVETAQQAADELKKLASGGYGVIFITEPYMRQIHAECARYDESAVPCIIPIPASAGAGGLGISRLKRYVEQAVGSDIIFNND